MVIHPADNRSILRKEEHEVRSLVRRAYVGVPREGLSSAALIMKQIQGALHLPSSATPAW